MKKLLLNNVIIIMHINVIIVHYTYVRTYNFILLLNIANKNVFTPIIIQNEMYVYT